MVRSKHVGGRENGRGKRGKKGRGGRKEYYQKLTQKKSINRWSEHEYLKLVALVRDFGENWDKISEHFVNKTAKQCMQKFKNSARSAKKGNWTEEEDQILMKWIKNHGPTMRTECSKNIRGRCGKQCRERWVNILNPGVKKGNWTQEEQKLIFQNLKRFFTSWSLMAKELDGRTENSIKNYFYSSVRRLKSNNIIAYLRAIYSEDEEDFGVETVPNYPAKLKNKVGLLVQNKDKIMAEISKLNCLSRMICEFMLDLSQVGQVILQGGDCSLWRNSFDEPNQDFLRFLIEIVLELNSNNSKGRGNKRKGMAARKGTPLTQENRNMRKTKMMKASISKKREAKPNKIMNSNIVNKQDVYCSNLSGVLNSGQFALPPPGHPDHAMGVLCHSHQLKKSRAQIEQEMFGDFKQKFFEANLDKIISWDELKSIAMATGNRDWGYVKYILTIICLMLKSYQSISETTSPTGSQKENPPREEGVEGVIDKMRQMDLHKPPKKRTPEPGTRELTEADVRGQLDSLNNIFKKMKNIDIQMNISNCWNCYNKFCTLHPLPSNLAPGSKLKSGLGDMQACSDLTAKPPRL